MEVIGKIVAGLIGLYLGDWSGLPLGGLIGFVAGSVAGHWLFDRPGGHGPHDPAFRAHQRRQGMFIAHVFRIIARIAKGDGPINSAEVRFMDNLMTHTFKMTEKGRVHAIRLWNQSKVSGDSFDRLLGAFFTDFSRERHQVLNMMDLMFAAAVCDGGLNSREEALLVRAAEVFRISAQQYDRIKRRHVPMVGASWGGWSAMDAYYTILGCSPGDSLEAVKKKYRVLAMQWHPDRLQSKGLSSEAMRHAQEKFRQINEAWERIEAAHRSGSR